MRVVKQPGEKWLVMLRQGGGQLDIAEKDDAVFDSEEGLIINHNDGGKTVTFAPKEGIGYIRAYRASGGAWGRGGGGKGIDASPALEETRPILEPEVRELPASKRKSLTSCDYCGHTWQVTHNLAGCQIPGCDCTTPNDHIAD